jgi:DNA-binding NarL/FixJ family response regulator
VLSGYDRRGRRAQRGCEQPDLVITDIIMPEQEGSHTITEMRKAGPDSKIIAVSGGAASATLTFPVCSDRMRLHIPR